MVHNSNDNLDFRTAELALVLSVNGALLPIVVDLTSVQTVV